MKRIINIISLLAAIVFPLFINPALANVQYRVAYDGVNDQYEVYMKPAALPAPDLALTAQVTIKVPHAGNDTGFTVNNIQSHIERADWQLYSQINSPSEDPRANYLSFGMLITGVSTPAFNWEVGVEKKIFTFQSAVGCRDGLALLENNDPFAQLPNSQGTNPANQFTNLGWASANSFTGNYGTTVNCQVNQPIITPPAVELCPKAEKKQQRIGNRMARLEMAMARLERKKIRLQARFDQLAVRKNQVINYCD